MELKKMQSGELQPAPKPSEIELKPKTFGEKVSNFWFHNSKIIIVLLFLFIAVIIMISQCATRIKYDLEVVYFTYSPVSDNLTNDMAKYFEKYADDVNGDGEVHIAVVNCSCDPYSNNNAKLTKMQSIIASEPKALLFITDSNSIKYFDNIKTSSGNFFEKIKYSLSDNFYSFLAENNNNVPSNLFLNIRNVSNTLVEKEKDIRIYLKSSKKLMDNIK
ncbi:MAG: hypothetical protein MJ090_02010 [Clostridia bacterium]|nr:hypothetical protein [Clostridia bacterium]